MNTEIRDRKTPHAITSNIYGGKSTDTTWAWCFANGDPDAKIIRKHIPKAHVYVAPNTQDIPDDQFRKVDLRAWHVDVWNQKVKNRDSFGKFMTNYEIREFLSKSNLSAFLGE